MSQTLTREQFEKAKQSGFTTDQIIGFEKKRLGEITQPQESIVDIFKPSAYTPKAIGERFKEALKETYAEGVSPIVSGLSTLALGIPKAFAKTQGVKEIIYPEQRTLPGKLLRIGAETGGLLGGGALKAGEWVAGKALSKLVVPKLAKRIIGGAITGGTFGALQTPEEGRGILKPEERLKQAATWGTLGAALPIAGVTLNKAGQVITKSGRWVAKNIGGITDATVTTIKRLGANRVFDPLKARADYISQNLAPKIYNKFIKFTDLADKTYKDAVKAFKGNTINSQPFYQEIQRGLRQKGWIDLQGNPTVDYKSGLDPVADKLTTLYLRMRAPTEGAKLFGKIISKEDFFTYRDALSSMLREKPSDRLVMQARNALYESAEKSGMSGIKIARDLEKKVFDIENKIDIKKITSDLVRAKNPQWTKVIQEEYRDLIGKGILDKKEYQDIFDDLMAHFANIDFELISETPGAGGGFIPTRARFIQKGIGRLSKQYYQRIAPKIPTLKSKLGEAFKRIIEK